MDLVSQAPRPRGRGRPLFADLLVFGTRWVLLFGFSFGLREGVVFLFCVFVPPPPTKKQRKVV